MSDSLNAQALPEVSLCRDLTAPKFDLAAIDIRGLGLLADYFTGLADVACGFLNQPRFSGPARDRDFAEDYFEHLNRSLDFIYRELEGRKPDTREDAEIRAQVLIRRLCDEYDFESIAAIAATVPTPLRGPDTQRE